MCTQCRRPLRDVLLQHDHGAVRIEGQSARQQPVEDHADRIQIRPFVHRLPAHVLRRHVRRRSHQAPVDGDVFDATHSRDPEVHDLDVACVADHHVRGLHVSMHDAGAMRVLESRQDPIHEMDGAHRRHRPFAIRQVIERLPGHELHHHQQIRPG